MFALVIALGIGNMTCAISPTPAEMAVARQWSAAKFLGTTASTPAAPYIEVVQNFGPVQVDSRGGKPLHFRDQDGRLTNFKDGLYCHAPSQLRVVLDKPAKGFEALAGVDSNDQTANGQGSVVFLLKAGDDVLWKSDILTEGSSATRVLVDLAGKTEFSLVIEDGGNGNACDQADWAEARILCEDGTALKLSDLPMIDKTAFQFDSSPFFSFKYDGKDSASFPTSWKIERSSQEIDNARVRHTVTYSDPVTGLVVHCEGIQYKDFPTVEWTLHFKNTGSADTPIISDICAIDTSIDRDPYSEFLLHNIRGDNCTINSYEPIDTPLPPKMDLRIANTGGRPTQEAFPYFNIEWASQGVLYALSWAGQWQTTFTRNDSTALRISGGQELTHFVLHPGEEVRGPMVVLQFYKGEWLRAQNVWRQWMLAHNTPKPGGKPLEPFRSLCNGNFFPNLMTVADQERAFLERHIEEKVDFNCWWQDAGWYPCDGFGWPKTGTWEVDPGRFPKGLRELSDLVRQHGIVTMVWFEPERVHPGTWLTDNHPEWVHGGASGGLLKLGDPACREWLTNHIDKLLTDQGIDYYRQDFNMDPLSFWRAADTDDRQGITEIRHVEGYLAYWDELIRRQPTRLIDSCASGGRRNDLETLRRAVPLLRSDWYWSPSGQQCLTYGLSLWIPYHGTGFIYDKDEYWIRSSMTPENSFGPGATGVEKTDFALLRRMTAEHHRIGQYLLGDFYPLTPYTQSEAHWMAWQFDRPDLGEGVVRVFRREGSIYESARLPLEGLDAEANYSIADIDSGEERVLGGQELMGTGLPVSMTERPSAKVYIYRRVR